MPSLYIKPQDRGIDENARSREGIGNWSDAETIR
jgi:hypothetical protein